MNFKLCGDTLTRGSASVTLVTSRKRKITYKIGLKIVLWLGKPCRRKYFNFIVIIESSSAPINHKVIN